MFCLELVELVMGFAEMKTTTIVTIVALFPTWRKHYLYMFSILNIVTVIFGAHFNTPNYRAHTYDFIRKFTVIISFLQPFWIWYTFFHTFSGMTFPFFGHTLKLASKSFVNTSITSGIVTSFFGLWISLWAVDIALKMK